jgi:hypothetical protein
MPKSYNATVWNDETKKYDEIPAKYDVVIRMNHNKTTNLKGETVVSLSNENNVDGEKIGDIFSHGLQGILDRANNPFPFKLQIVKEALSTINHLIEAGVGVPETFAFINNPWIVEYIKKQMYYGGSMAKLQDEPVLKHQVKSKAFRETLNNMLEVGGEKMKKTVKALASYANDRRLSDIADMLKNEDKTKTYIFTMYDSEGTESAPMRATGQRMFHTKDFPLDKIIELKEFAPNKAYEEQKTLFKRSSGIANNDNFYYAAQAAWTRAFGDTKEVTVDYLKRMVTQGLDPTMGNLALLMHMMQLEKQFKGMDELEMAFSPDTGLMDTTLQIKKRDDAFKMFENEQSKIDNDFLKRLRNDSILSSFYKSGLIMDLVVPLFPLRLNESISNFIETKIDQNRDMIAQKFGPGIKGKERFTNNYNNAVVNYIFQNTMSNYPDENGQPVTLPETVHSLPVTEVTTGPAVSFTDKDVKVNVEQAKKDFDARIFLSSNNTPEGNQAKKLDTFDVAENPFPTFASYLKFVVEKEYLTTVYTKESLAKNKDFIKLSNQSGSQDLGYDKYITQRALMNGFNRAFIMGTTKYSYTGMVMDIINEFEDQNIKDNFPVLAQLAPAKFTKDVNVLELNDKATAKGSIADDYYKNLKQLADPTVRKVVNTDKTVQKDDNKRISDIFKNFSMLMFYQHGTGYSKLGFVRVLDPEAFTQIMQNAANSFLNNDLSEKTFERIYNRLNTKSQFKDYIVDPNNLSGEESVDDYLDTFSDDDFADMADFLGEAPAKDESGKVLEGDIFTLSGIPVITTNLGGVHGAGLAQAAKAKGLVTQGDGNFKATDTVVQLPVKQKWSDSMAMNNNMELLKQSLRSLIKTARDNKDNTYLLPLAGLGHGEGSIADILPLLIKTVQAADNIKLVLPAENVNLGRQGTVRKDTTRVNMPQIKAMLEEAGLLGDASENQPTQPSENKSFKNSLFRGQEDAPIINENGDLVILATYDPLFKSTGSSFAKSYDMAQGYGTRYSKNPYVIEINKDYADKISPLIEGGTQAYGNRVVGDQGEERFISENDIIIPKGMFTVHRADRTFNTNTYSAKQLIEGYNKQFIEDDIAEYNRYGEASQGYATEGSDYYEAIENELLKRGISKNDFVFLQQANPIYSLKEIVAGIFNIQPEPGELEPEVSQDLINKYLSKHKELLSKLENSQNQPTGLSQFTNHSGGAYGGDTYWDMIGREFGVTNHKHYRHAGNTSLSAQLKKAGVEAEVLTEEQMDAARTEVEKLLGEKYPDNIQGNLQVRNYYQVANADAVYAIAEITQVVDKDAPKNTTDITKSVNSYKHIVKGGTNTAVQLGIKLGKPVYVWDLATQSWYKWDGNRWFEETDTPTLTKNFAGIGSRDIESYNIQKEGKWVPREQYKGSEVEAAAKQAIRDVYENTLNQTEQVSVETVAAGPAIGITEFYNGLTEAQRKILGNLEDLINEYENIPFDYSEGEYIESLKCKLQ